MAEEVKLGNPAVVGLAGFGMTTLILQFHNLGLVGLGPVIWIGLLFGGSAKSLPVCLSLKLGIILDSAHLPDTVRSGFPYAFI